MGTPALESEETSVGVSRGMPGSLLTPHPTPKGIGKAQPTTAISAWGQLPAGPTTLLLKVDHLTAESHLVQDLGLPLALLEPGRIPNASVAIGGILTSSLP